MAHAEPESGATKMLCKRIDHVTAFHQLKTGVYCPACMRNWLNACTSVILPFCFVHLVAAISTVQAGGS